MTTLDARPEVFLLSDDPEAALGVARSSDAWSHGCVRVPFTLNGRTGKPERDGLLCARIFGPIQDHRCLCGRLEGAEHSGSTCPRCGVLCDRASLRAERWGHLHAQVPLFHPACFGPIRDELGCTDEELRKLLDGELLLHRGSLVPEDQVPHDDQKLGAEGVAAACPQWGIHHVPLPPPTWRATWRDPVNRTATTLCNRLNRLNRLRELNAPPIILRNEARYTQRAFESYVRIARREIEAMRAAPTLAPLPEAVHRLFEAVYTDPVADGPRAVLADALADLGDPRGEYITLQLQRTSKRPGTREGALLRRYRSDWLGPLEPAVSRVWFLRGFPAGARTTPTAHDLVDLQAWATFEHLDTDCVALLEHPRLRALRSVAVSGRTWVALARGTGELPLEHAEIRVGRQAPKEWARVAGAARFPHLTSLSVVTKHREPADWSWLQGAPLVARLDALEVRMPFERLEHATLGVWCDLACHGPAVTVHFGRHGASIQLGRTIVATLGQGLLERLMLAAPEFAVGLGRALSALADRADKLVIELGEPVWLYDALAEMAVQIHQSWGARVTLPSVWLEQEDGPFAR